MSKILLVHNILWSHYKAAVFSALYDICQRKGKNLAVVQIAATERSRKSIGQIDFALHRYPYRLLFEESFEAIGKFRRSAVLCREIISQRPDIVILPGYYDISFWFALLIIKLLGIPAILTCDSTAMDQSRAWHKELMKKLFVRACDAAFGYGRKAKEYLQELGMPKQSIYIRYQATNNTEIAAINHAARCERDARSAEYGFRPRNFIYVGRLSPEKNVGSLVRAFNKLKEGDLTATDWGLLLVGDGPQRLELTNLCTKLKVTDVHFIGGKKWQEVSEFYAVCDVMVLPSTSEPWGLVVNEAMVCGLPVLVSDRCGAAYDLVKEDENGFIFDPFNVEELAELMKYFVVNSERIAEMGKRSVEIVAEYTPERAAQQMYAGIEQVLGNKLA